MRHYYAVEYAYGGSTVGSGLRANRLRRFKSEKARNAWVSEGDPYASRPASRDSIPASDPRIRSRDAHDWLLIDEDWQEREGPAN